jgi:hypothetical protein
MRELARRPPAGLEIHAAPDLHAFLSAAGSGGWQAFAGRRGGAVVLEVDSALAPGGHRITELS